MIIAPRRPVPRRGGVYSAVIFVVLAGMYSPRLQAQTAGRPPANLPPLLQTDSQEHHVGKIIFAELVTPNLAVAKGFYTNLFGWSYQDIKLGGLDFAEALLDGRPIAALIGHEMPEGEKRQPAWLPFLAVRDVDAALAAAVGRGAKRLYEPHNFPQLGREAILADPQGAVCAMLASSSGDPPDLLPDPGDWIWSSLITSDPDQAAAFYQAVFDYSVFDVPDESETGHLILASDDVARASVNSLPAGWQHARPHWLNYARVDDASAMATKVTALGGRVLIPPQIDRHGGKIAVVADPTGAVFGVMEWQSGAPPRGAK